MSPVRLSVVIPALNEAARIGATLAAARAATPPDAEILVVDGGSGDGTAEAAAEAAAELPCGPARILRSLPGRARQMNAGAEEARGDVLLFLHADTLLPPGAGAAIRRALEEPGVEAGAFRLGFDLDTPLLRFYARCTHLDWPLICFGDRGLFVRRDVFEAVGGYPPIPIFEDLELVRALAARGGFRFVDEAVVTAARRFERYGQLRQQLRNLLLWSAYVLGVPPTRLASLYRYDRLGG